jgi:hypothetical protein
LNQRYGVRSVTENLVRALNAVIGAAPH